MQQSPAADPTVKSRTENRAAEAMWTYYREHKAELSPDVKNFRDVILSELMLGVPVEQVFARFRKEPEPPAPIRRTRTAK